MNEVSVKLSTRKIIYTQKIKFGSIMIHVSILFSSAFWREGLPIGNEGNHFEQKFGFGFCDN